MNDIKAVKLLTAEECKYLLSFSSKFSPSGITIHGQDTFNDYRISEDCSVADNPQLNAFLLSKLSPYDINSIPSVGFIKYTEGSRFNLHRDRHDSTGLFTYRYKTLIIQLSDKSDYEGGELIIEKTVMPKDIGSVILFNSKYLHEVTELKRGTRYSLCLFLTSGNFNSSIL
jgi:hypothetical protein